MLPFTKIFGILIIFVSSKSTFDQSLAYINLRDDLEKTVDVPSETNQRPTPITSSHMASPDDNQKLSTHFEIRLFAAIIVALVIILAYDLAVSWVRIYVAKNQLTMKPPPYLSKTFLKGVLLIFNKFACANQSAATIQPRANNPTLILTLTPSTSVKSTCFLLADLDETTVYSITVFCSDKFSVLQDC